MRQSAEISLEGGSPRSPNLSPVPFPLVPETEKEGVWAPGQHLTSVPQDVGKAHRLSPLVQWELSVHSESSTMFPLQCGHHSPNLALK